MKKIIDWVVDLPWTIQVAVGFPLGLWIGDKLANLLF